MFGPFHDSQKEVPMRAVVAAFLAPFLIATPLTQVLAQTGQQGPRVVQTDNFRVTIPVPTRTFQTSERPHLLSWVPSVERNSPAALLWAAGAIDSTAASEPLLYAVPARTSTGKTVGIVLAIVVILFFGVLVICAVNECTSGGG